MASAGLNFLEGAMRAGAAAARGYFEAKVEVAQARNQRDLQRANNRLAEARNKLLAQKNRNDYMLGRMQIESGERQHKMTMDLQKFTVEKDTEGKMYIVDRETGVRREVAEIAAESAENVAQTQADAQVKSAEAGAEAAKSTAQTQADAQTSVAQTQAEAGTEQARIGAEAQVKSAEAQAGAQVQVAEVGAAAAERVADIESETKRLTTLATSLKQSVPPAMLKSFDGAFDILLKNELHKGIVEVQGAWGRGKTAVELALDGNRSAQITLVNAFMQMTDPGVSVREGEFQAVRQNLSDVIEQAGLTLKRLMGEEGDGGFIMSTEGVLDLAETMQGLHNAAIRTWDTSAAGRKQVEAYAQQVGVSEYIANFLNNYKEDNSTFGTPAGDQSTLGTDGRLLDDADAGAAPSATDVVSRLMSAVDQKLAKGESPDQIMNALRASLQRNNYDEARISEIFEAVRTAKGWQSSVGQSSVGDAGAASPNKRSVGGNSGEAEVLAEAQALADQIRERTGAGQLTTASERRVRTLVRSRLMKLKDLSTVERKEIEDRIVAQVLGGQ